MESPNTRSKRQASTSDRTEPLNDQLRIGVINYRKGDEPVIRDIDWNNTYWKDHAYNLVKQSVPFRVRTIGDDMITDDDIDRADHLRAVEKDNTAVNTDRELWREREGDFYSPSIHVTAHGGIGINVSGTVHVRTLSEWHKLLDAPQTPSKRLHGTPLNDDGAIKFSGTAQPITCANCGEASTNPGQFLGDGRWVCCQSCRSELS